MSDMLSQDEINALLNGLNNDDNEESDENGTSINIEDYISSIEQDALGEIGNISFGSAATALSTLLNQKVDITTPKVSVIPKQELEEQFPKPHVAIHVKYTEGFEGMNVLVIKTHDAAVIANLMLGGDGTEIASDDLGEMEISAVQEAMNQMMGSASTSMSTIFNKKVDISPPGIDLMDVKEGQGTKNIPDDDILVKISFNLKVGTLIDSQIMQLVTVSFAKELVDQLMNPSSDEEELLEEPVSQAPNQGHQEQNEQVTEFEQPSQQAPQQHEQQVPQMQQYDGAPQGQYYEQQPPTPRQPQSFGGPAYASQNQRAANVQPVAFSNFEPPSLNDNESKNLNMLLDINLQVTVELGRTKRSIKEILELSQGSIIELDKLAGEPVDILVNNKLIAKGEVVVIDENFGVRVTDIISQTDRLKNLQ
ncbi:flagellar motor switch phosphatase FliY [Anaerobacillus arseniciselenatis]|uniref:Flagellar motor switch phosphatase FliY n=1 Tax=Anaerobacillus arseniciselenatis TaxID=85682 RepID=A0A1S2LBP4_9BACI|nr:flagellar motor switch phosphatase FliY [Anaerobacillus arseniciselenatis]OIJ09912.1 flagellar motor switch phosphatase FliY [Anaerobacillus arseniciselenatis]